MSDTFEQYGRYIDTEGCFDLTNEPPRKWRNIHYNEPGEHEVYAEISNIGDGPIVVRDNVGNSCQLVGYDSKFIYIRDDETNVTFTPWGDPVPTPTKDRSCKFYASQTVTTGTAAELRVTHRVFVPRKELFEAWTTTVENLSDRPRTVSLFAYAMFQLTGTNSEGGGVWKDNHSEIHPDLNGVLIINRNPFVPNGRFNGYLVTLNKDAFAGASGYRDVFTRTSYSLGDPKIVYGWNCDNKDGRGPDCAGIVQVRLTIPARSKVRADFLIGQTKDKDEVRAVLGRTTPKSLDAAADEQMTIEKRRAGAFTIDTGHKNIDGLINHFVKKQMVSYLINKSGFRDNMQNDMGVAMFEYPMARTNMLRAISSQYEDGSFPHGFRPFNRHQYSDKPAWILHCVPWVIKESGDFSLLDEVVGYDRSTLKETIWQHMIRAMRFLAKDVGANGLSDQHHADWNDGLEPSAKTGARESIMVSQQFCLGLLEMYELAKRRKDVAIEQESRELYKTFAERLNDVAWDGEWYVRTICASGFRLGSKQNEEGKIFINSQTWAILSQTAPPNRAKSCMEALDHYLENDYGISLAAPAFSKFDERVGKFSASRPYVTENGGCYNHAAGFKAVADCMMGRAEHAWRTLIKVVPDSPWNRVSNSEIEPFSFTNCYSITAEHPGISHYPWRTGTGCWFTMLAVEWILGARRNYDGLLISPCLSKEVPRAKVVRTFRGARYEIELDNTAGRSIGAKSILLDGKPIQGNVLPDLRSGTHTVQVTI